MAKAGSSGQEHEKRDSRAVAERGQAGSAQKSSIPSIWGLPPQELWLASPFDLMRRMTEEMDRLFGTVNAWGSGSSTGSRMWSPPIEVTEREGAMVVSVELPGISKDDVKVELMPDGLLIQGERKEEHEEQQKGVLRSERRYGRFSRLIPLPEGVEAGQAKAEFNNGMLEVRIPISEETRQRREIPIEGSGSQGARAA